MYFKDLWQRWRKKRVELSSPQLYALDGAYIVSVTDAAGKICHVNEKFTAATGYTKAEMLGATHRLLDSGHHAPHVFDNLRRTLREGQTWKGELCQKRKNGALFWVEASVVPVRGRYGEVEHYVCLAQDVTARKSTESDLQAAYQKAVAAVSTKATFLANMTHEIRTPMNGILGMCQLMEESVTSPNQREQLRIIQNCGTSLLELVNDVLDFSKLEAEKILLEAAPFSLPALVEEVMALYQSKAREKSLRLTYRAEPGSSAWIVSDPTRLRQVVSNLVSNAIKFTEKGEVEVVSSVRPSAAGLEVAFRVRDTGIGVPSELKDRLFRAFSQVDASTTRKFGGTGLGLAICKGLCEKMGGKIWLESKWGQGTTVHFVITAQAPHGVTADPAPALPAPNPVLVPGSLPLKVLVAEDNHVNQLVLMGYLKRLGFEADLVTDGRAATQKAQDGFYDLILMDCQMPEMDGFEATQIIRQRSSQWQRRPRIVAVTASNSPDEISRCVASGMDEVLSKPVVLSELAAVLSRAGADHNQGEVNVNPLVESLDLSAMLFHFRGIEDVALDMFRAFIPTAPDRIAKIEAALRAQDGPALAMAAHSLRGSLSYFHHAPSVAAAEAVEDAAHAGDFAAAAAATATLRQHVETLLAFIAQAVEEKGA